MPDDVSRIDAPHRAGNTGAGAVSWDLDVGLIYTHEDHWIEPLLQTLPAAASGANVRLLLVDNVSDQGAERWSGYVPQTTILRNERRLGYAENLNRILAASRARYVLLMNTDMLFDPAEPCLTKMVEFMDAHPQCGLSAARLYRYDGSYGYPARRFPTWQTAVGRRFGENRYFQRHLAEYLYLDRDPHSTMPCDWVSGCFMFVRREAAERVGPLDEGFRKYFEDVDWCARMTAAGYDVMLNGDTHCFHAEQRASKKVLSTDGRQHLRSYARWLWKYRSGLPRAATVAASPRSTAATIVMPRLPVDGRFDVRRTAAAPSKSAFRAA